MEVMKVFIDKREPYDLYEEAVFLTSIVENLEGFKIKRKQLKVGDFVFKDLIAERKTIKDFIGSIHDARIFQQLFNMTQNFNYVYLLISGNILHCKRADRQAILTTIADAEMRYNIRVRFCGDDESLVYYFLMLCYKLQRDLKPKWRIRRATPSIKDEQVNVLVGINNLGKKTVNSLLDKFGSPQKVCNAPISKMIEIKGLGLKRAKHINSVLTKIRPKKKK